MVGRNYGDRPYFLDVANGREWTVGELVLAGRPENLSSASPAVSGTVRHPAWRRCCRSHSRKTGCRARVERGKGGGFALVDHKGMLVYRHPAIHATWEERTGSSISAFEEVLKGKEVSKTVYAPYEGKDRLVSFLPFPPSAGPSLPDERKRK